MRDVSICDAMNASCHNTTYRGDQTSKNHNCQNIEQVFTGVPVHIQHVFSGVPTISNRGSMWVNGVPATQKTLQISVVNREIQIFECSLFYRALLQKRTIILRSLLIVATPYKPTTQSRGNSRKWEFKAESWESESWACTEFELWAYKILQDKKERKH